MGSWREVSSAVTELRGMMGTAEGKGEQGRLEMAGTLGATCLCAGVQQCWVFHPSVVRDLAAK